MKKFIVIVSIIVLIVMGFDIAYYRLGIYIDLNPDKEVSTLARTDGDRILVDTGSGFEDFEIRGVDMGSGIPGEWSTDFAIDKETYLRWFRQIKELGANTLRIYTVQSDDFYDAFYEYNHDNPDPLYLIQGVWVNDYAMNSKRDAYDSRILGTFEEDCKSAVDVIHGSKKLSQGDMESSGNGTYTKDISKWVIGYILGVEWEDVTVAYTDEKYKDNEKYNSYSGEYMYSSEDATPFEALLARVGDLIISYESKRYKQQRLIAFSNWPTTDPFDYPDEIAEYYQKCAKVDVEQILTTDKFISGQFASYHVYPYYPDYLSYVDDYKDIGIKNINKFKTEDGKINTYKAYLSMLTDHHTMPVVISEFGVSTGRGMAQRDRNTGRNQGHMSEKDQGEALIECYEDITDTGCAGGCVFSWQDEWFKRTWNTMYAINMKRNPYWSDYQTNEQYFGLLSFDPGEEESICYVDGNTDEWSGDDVVMDGEDISVSMKYDEKFVYFMVEKDKLNLEKDKIYIPIDTTQKSGSTYCDSNGLKFERATDFLIVIDGRNKSRMLVQERYEALRSTYSENIWLYDTYAEGKVPERSSSRFVPIDMILQTATVLESGDVNAPSEVYETGKLRYGNANPKSKDYDSLADFCAEGDRLEIKIPWQMLNFSDPSRMEIHDDYYDGNYGIEHINISRMYIGAAAGVPEDRIAMKAAVLEGWDKKVTYHERLKPSYYMLQKYWRKDA